MPPAGSRGAGRKLDESTQFCTVDEDFTAYGLITHRHTPEMEQAIGAEIIFTPHLAPMNRGILATCYARPAPGQDAEPLDILAKTYAGEPFVVVSDRSPSTKAALGSNTAHVTARGASPDRLGGLDMCAGQPGERSVRPSCPVRQRGNGLAGDDRAGSRRRRAVGTAATDTAAAATGRQPPPSPQPAASTGRHRRNRPPSAAAGRNRPQPAASRGTYPPVRRPGEGGAGVELTDVISTTAHLLVVGARAALKVGGGSPALYICEFPSTRASTRRPTEPECPQRASAPVPMVVQHPDARPSGPAGATPNARSKRMNSEGRPAKDTSSGGALELLFKHLYS